MQITGCETNDFINHNACICTDNPDERFIRVVVLCSIRTYNTGTNG